ncbi:hypothetical protein OEA41_002641 [Lepraria neglecta]|uniref:Uncharacterized protein n=1 Tax=Lepraria neglecta TaxID=209136 RepID=A0AAE0DIM4_9LECA|nr:hypothetical protein OEA41_002641 [Lepraria neglecta]
MPIRLWQVRIWQWIITFTKPIDGLPIHDTLDRAVKHEKTWRDFFDHQSKYSFGAFYPGTESARSPYWRLLTSDAKRKADSRLARCEAEDYKSYFAWLSESRKLRDDKTWSDEKMWSFDNDFSNNRTNHRLFFTQSGCVGVGPKALQSGDSIYVLAGGCFTYALRPVLDAPRPKTFELVGDILDYTHIRERGNCIFDLVEGDTTK